MAASDRIPRLERDIARDPELLLRSALTYNWDLCSDICEILLRRQWREQAQRQLARRDQWGNNCQHAACYNQPPAQVVNLMLQVARGLNLHSELARDGSSPLQVACACMADIDVIQLLLEQPGGVKMVLHSDNQGLTPLTDLVTQYNLKLSSTRDGSKALRDVDLLNPSHRTPTFETFFDKAELLLRSCFHVDNPAGGRGRSVVHDVARAAAFCPTDLSDMILRCYPSYASVKCGRFLPLHLAIMTNLPPAEETARNGHAAERQAQVVRTLIRQYPQAVRENFPGPDFSGLKKRNLLCCGIVTGCSMTVPSGKQGTLRAIIEEEPSLVLERDSVTRLPPFALACAHDLPLDTVYQLVRVAPALLHERDVEA